MPSEGGYIINVQQIPRPKDHAQPLLLDRLDLDEAHGRTGRCFHDRLGVGHVVFLGFHIRPDELRRDQPHLVAETRQHASPVVSRGAGLHRNNKGVPP